MNHRRLFVCIDCDLSLGSSEDRRLSCRPSSKLNLFWHDLSALLLPNTLKPGASQSQNLSIYQVSVLFLCALCVTLHAFQSSAESFNAKFPHASLLAQSVKSPQSSFVICPAGVGRFLRI